MESYLFTTAESVILFRHRGAESGTNAVFVC